MNLILDTDKKHYKEKASRLFSCSGFDPDGCCYCYQIDKFIDKLAITKHNRKVCASEE